MATPSVQHAAPRRPSAQILARWGSIIAGISLIRLVAWLALPIALSLASHHRAAVWAVLIGALAAAAEIGVSIQVRPRLRRWLLRLTAEQALRRSLDADPDRLGQLVASAYEAESAVLSTMPGIASSGIALIATIALSVRRFGVAQLAPWIAALAAVYVLRRVTRGVTARRIDAEVDANNGMIAYVQLCLQGASELGRGRAAEYVVARTGDAAAEWAHAEIRRESVYRLRRAALLGTFLVAGAFTAIALDVHPERWTLSSLALLDAAWPVVLLPMALSLVHALDLASHSLRAIDVAELGHGIAPKGDARITRERGAEIRAHEFVVRYGDSLALDGIEFRVPMDGVIVVVGPNAAGKSTLARALAGIVAPTSGALTLAGTEPRSIAPDEIAYVPQQPAFLASRSVLENVVFTAPSLDHEAIEAGFAKLQVGVEPQRLVSTLSGGQRRRVAVARALLRDPRLLVLDEADAGLDRDAREWLAETVREASADRVVVVVTHHPALFAFADAVIVLDERHRLVDAGSPAALEARCAAYRALVRADETFGSAGLEPDEAVLRGTG